MLIGVLSDTHWRCGFALPSALNFFRASGVEAILHAGDLTEIELLRDLQEIAPTYAVLGNCDNLFYSDVLPRRQVVELAGKRIGLVHGDGAGTSTQQRALAAFQGETVDAVVFGHSHIPVNQQQDDVLIFNPGSTSRPKGERKEPSCGLLYLDEKGLRGEIIYLPVQGCLVD